MHKGFTPSRSLDVPIAYTDPNTRAGTKQGQYRDLIAPAFQEFLKALPLLPGAGEAPATSAAAVVCLTTKYAHAIKI